MILANSFHQSQNARENEFTTNSKDKPLITQFAANNAYDISLATKLVFSFCDGVDINCGCPQRWAMAEGMGAKLSDDPELVKDMILQTRNRLENYSNPQSSDSFTISVKIRIHEDMKRTIDLVKKVESAGASFITIHGRTKYQKHDPVNFESIRLISTSLNIPIIANGDCFTLQQFHEIGTNTRAAGVMSARGLLQNPALFQ
eukprot:Sdes_comp19980_c0_seq3m12568